MKKIDISTKKYPNTFALVDDDDFSRLSVRKWRPIFTKTNAYALAFSINPSTGRESTTRMHRVIMGVEHRSYCLIDHVNRDGLDNRKLNLRIATSSQNGMNSNMYSNNKSGYKGVYWWSYYNKWRAAITFNNKRRYLGLFTCLIKAAKAYDKAAIEHHGQFANLNFPKK